MEYLNGNLNRYSDEVKMDLSKVALGATEILLSHAFAILQLVPLIQDHADLPPDTSATMERDALEAANLINGALHTLADQYLATSVSPKDSELKITIEGPSHRKELERSLMDRHDWGIESAVQAVNHSANLGMVDENAPARKVLVALFE